MTKKTGTVRPKLSAVAAQAGVSTATASKVVNGRPDVAEGTRERVETAITELGYRGPSRAGAARTVELMVDILDTAYATQILRGVVLAAEELGIDVVVGRVRRRSARGVMESSAAWAQRLAAAEHVGAIVLTSGLGPDVYGSLARARIPLVVIDPLDVAQTGVVSVGSTNWLGGRSAAEHLVGLGHQHIGVIAGPAESISAMARLDGFLSYCRQKGVEVEPDLVRPIRFDHDQAVQVAEDWFRRPGPPTAIFAGSDAQAMGVLEAARRTGLLVPEDVSLVAYDDTPIASWANPPLTAVRQPLEEIGRRALLTVRQLHVGNPVDSHHIEIATTLVVRDSTAPPRTGLVRRTRS
ncbi:transcriptional regulator, LacI family [Promicromonospora umidemergens]|uniref:LacI family DNA-binding transcriptional regulator n=1 Tax=Promicromonospora umidemergens TaxID=629679 RepID=A0ABP8WZ89_9MICO|nr:LacI family DNA-binding transcriptional regulator [Promicromonospora umidemergens]MCP2285482.1 transcriptional regulator, LacI family [Promicromonospora umidemergens]